MFWILILCFVGLSTADAGDPTLVTLPQGQIRGRGLLSPDGNIYYAFQEIPYAAPPIGNLRFQAPVEHEKWEGVLNTTENTKVCYQGRETPGLTRSEDCLHLNVYTPLKPGDTSEDPLPVLVWTHGGAFLGGNGAMQYVKPQYVIDHRIVVVTIHYRLGALGFLTTEDGVIPGNIGLKDQHFALKWVKQNINLFGGDPEKITLAGQSAGGTSVGLQLVSERNKGLFRAAILQSGTALCQWGHQNYAQFYAFELGRRLNPNFTSDNSQELLKLLQNVPASVLIETAETDIHAAIGKEVGLVEGDSLVWVPVIEDKNLEGALLTGLFHEDIKLGNINQVPIIIGFNSEEEISFMSEDPTLPESRAAYLDNDLSNLIRNKFNMTKENKLTAGIRLKQIYTEGTFEEEPGAVVKFFSDESFTTPIIRHAKLQSNYTDVYLYQFSYKGKMGGLLDAEVAGVRGVGHAEELGYLWDKPINSDGSPHDQPDDPQDLVIRQQMLTLWTNFVKYLNPTPEKDSLLGNVTWEKVAPNNLVYLNINSTLEMQRNPKEYIRWERIIDPYAIPPLVNY